MKKKREKILISALLVFLIVCNLTNLTNAHSGRTDSQGGHKDKKNASGLGPYHYHCGGNPPHLHTNGICPYAKTNDNKSNTKTKSNTNGKKSTKSTTSGTSKTQVSSPKTTTQNPPVSEKQEEKVPVPEKVPIEVENVKIQPVTQKIQVGDTLYLHAKVEPDTSDDKQINWSTTNKETVDISSNGYITAKRQGTVQITATSNNGKSDTITIQVEPKQIVENVTHNTISPKMEEKQANKTKNHPLGTLIGVFVIVSVGYWGYEKWRQYTKSTKQK